MITERSAYRIVADLTEAGYVLKQRDGRRNRYELQTHLPLGEPVGRDRTVGEMLELLVEPTQRRKARSSRAAVS